MSALHAVWLAFSGAISFVTAIEMRYGFSVVSFDIDAFPYELISVFVFVHLIVYFIVVRSFDPLIFIWDERPFWAIFLNLKVVVLSIVSFYLILFVIDRLDSISRSIPFLQLLVLLFLQLLYSNIIHFCVHKRKKYATVRILQSPPYIAKSRSFFSESVAHKHLFSDLIAILFIFFGVDIFTKVF